MAKKGGKVRGIYLPEELWQKLEREAARQNRSVSNLIAFTLKTALEHAAR
jgi:hypothetical protein